MSVLYGCMMPAVGHEAGQKDTMYNIAGKSHAYMYEKGLSK